MKTINLAAQANEILQKAEERGVQSNFFFVTTFKRYQVQMKILEELERTIAQDGAIIPDAPIRGSGAKANPAVTEYNKTATAANGTVATLIKIIEALSEEEEGSNRLRELLDAGKRRGQDKQA